MWDHDCGCVPVVDETNTIQGMITDRDVCMAALMQGKSLGEISVGSAMSRAIYGCSPTDDIEKAAERALSRSATNGVSSPTVARTLFDIFQPGA